LVHADIAVECKQFIAVSERLLKMMFGIPLTSLRHMCTSLTTESFIWSFVFVPPPMTEELILKAKAILDKVNASELTLKWFYH
jgi:hypothetical protein